MEWLEATEPADQPKLPHGSAALIVKATAADTERLKVPRYKGSITH
jgi:hypothetical protein